MTSNLDLLTLCMIVKNDERESITLSDAISSVAAYVDFINVTVTKNTEDERIKDALTSVLSGFGDKVQVSEFIWCDDFAAARNFNMNLAETELIFWIDSDDIVVGAENLREAVYAFKKYPALNAIWMDYRYAYDADGNCNTVFPRERIFKKSIYSWKGRLHENALCSYQPVKKDAENIYIKHNLNQGELVGKGERNLRVIEAAFAAEAKNENPDPRTFYDYARSLVAVGSYAEAESVFDSFLKITESENDAYDALMRLCEINILSDDIFKARKQAFTALNLKYEYPDAYLALAKCAFANRKWEETLHWIEKAKNLKPYDCGLPLDPLTYNLQPMKMAADCLFFLNRAKESLDIICEALKIAPSDVHLQTAKKRNESYLKQISLEEGVMTMLSRLQELKDQNSMKCFLQSLPQEVRDMPAVIRAKNKTEGRKTANRIVIYCHETHEDWGVDKVISGIGGSEEAVINISRELALLGWNVEVYCSCSSVGMHDGVLWRQFYEHDPKVPCDVFIAWRHSEYILFAPKNSYKVLWLHDRQTIANYTPQVIDSIDRIFVLSDYHRKDLPEIADDKFYITRNGINSDKFEFAEEDVIAAESSSEYKNNIIYASSPDRGVDIVLDNWGEVKKINPNAKLHIFYGFTPTYDEVYSDNKERMSFKRKVLRQVEELPDVFYHGRVGHDDLARWFQRCGFWFYPTYFTEISCITAMKAQAAGAIPIAVSLAALKETINSKITPVVDGDILNDAVLQEWLALYEGYMSSNNFKVRNQMRRWAIDQFSYSGLAKDWSDKFKKWIKRKMFKKKRQKALAV